MVRKGEMTEVRGCLCSHGDLLVLVVLRASLLALGIQERLLRACDLPEHGTKTRVWPGVECVRMCICL